MKDFELSHESVANLEEQAQKAGADKDEDQSEDSVEQELKVPTERSEEDATKFVQKEYKQKSGLELDEDTAREIVNTGQSGSGSSDSESAPDSESDSASESDSKSESDSDSDSKSEADAKG